MTTSAGISLLGDIGATNARFALLADGVLSAVRRVEVRHYPHFFDAIEVFLKEESLAAVATRALFAVAGPVKGDRFKFTNCSWTIDSQEMQSRFDFQAVRIINDFEATALSLPHLLAKDVLPLGGGHAVAGAPMVVLGPGSGLGVAGLVGEGPRRIVVASEGGHVTLAAASSREDAVLDQLRQRFGHVSAERVLSGPGLVNLYGAIAEIDGIGVQRREASEITNAALDGTCPTSSAALDMFCAMLGGFAGNAALTYGARGGIYIAGGIAPRILDYLAGSEFRARFVQKGRFKNYLEAIPTQVIIHSEASFLGLMSLVSNSVDR
jgi:glucokinase